MKFLISLIFILSTPVLANNVQDRMANYRKLEKNLSEFSIDAALYGFSNTFGETDEVLGIDLITPFMHGSGLFFGMEKGLRNISKSIRWGLSFGLAAAVDKTKASQFTFKWRAFGMRFFRDREFGEFFSGIDIGIRFRLMKHLTLNPQIRAEIIQRGSDDAAELDANTPLPGGNISASLGLSFYL